MSGNNHTNSVWTTKAQPSPEIDDANLKCVLWIFKEIAMSINIAMALLEFLLSCINFVLLCISEYDVENCLNADYFKRLHVVKINYYYETMHSI